MATTAALPLEYRLSDLPEKVDPYHQQLSYGRRAIPKLIEELHAADTRVGSLVSLGQLFHTAENIADGLKCGVVPRLTELIAEDNLVVKQKGTECLLILSGHAVGRLALIESKTIYPLSRLFNDADDLVRRNVHLTINALTTNPRGADVILLHDLFPQLIDQVTTERVLEVQVSILDTIYNLLRFGSKPKIPNDALACGALDILTKLMKSDNAAKIKERAAQCVMMLCFHHEAKQLAIEKGTLTVLIALLSDWKSEVRAASAGALMSITINVEAKKIAVREGVVPILMDLLNDKNESVLLNVIKTITSVSEDYRGRFQLHSCLKKLEEIKNKKVQGVNVSDQLSEAAAIAIKVITWRP